MFFFQYPGCSENNFLSKKHKLNVRIFPIYKRYYVSGTLGISFKHHY